MNEVPNLDELQTLITKGLEPKTGPNDELIILVPEGYRAEVHTKDDDPLERIVEYLSVCEAKSYSEYINKFKLEDTAIFSDAERGTMKCVIDYHGKEQAAHCGQVINFLPAKSDQWKAWRNITDMGTLSQRQFLEFIQENMEDITDPDGATLMDMAANFQGIKKAKFKSGMRLSDNTVQMQWEEEVKEGDGEKGQISFPTELTVGLPVYQGDIAYKMKVFLYYSIDDGQLIFSLKRHRSSSILKDAMAELAKQVEEATGITPYQV